MGCCCFECLEEENYSSINPNNVSVEIEPEHQKEQGNLYFRAGNYPQAIQHYCRAIATISQTEKPNNKSWPYYTNLALAYKASGELFSSIDTINLMLQLAEIEPGIALFVVKGKIIKARCQTQLTKDYYLGNQKQTDCDKISSESEALHLIKDAVESMRGLKQDVNYAGIAQSLGIDKYFHNTLKLYEYCRNHSDTTEDEELLRFLKQKVSFSSLAESQKFANISLYIKQPADILIYVEERINSCRKAKFQDDDIEQIITDPITYQQMKQPMIVASGLSYQSTSLKQHYIKNGSHDPITRQEYFNELGVKNRTLFQYIMESKQKMSKNLPMDIQI